MRIDSVLMPMTQPTDNTQSASKAKEDEKLKDACKSFEAMLTGIMLKGMRKTVTKSDVFGSGSGEEMFQEMMDNETCQSASKSGSVGIADMLYRQLSNDDTATKQEASYEISRTTVVGPDVADMAVRFGVTDQSEGASK